MTLLITNAPSFADLEFGFVPASVTVPESIGTVNLNATLVNGQIADGLIIALRASTDDNNPRTTATGRYPSVVFLSSFSIFLVFSHSIIMIFFILAGEDYISVAQLRLEFTSGTTVHAVPIRIINDKTHEPTETIEVSLSDASIVRPDGSTTLPIPSSRIKISMNPAQVIIIDDDSESNDSLNITIYNISIYQQV